jgi:LysM repeat protein
MKEYKVTAGQTIEDVAIEVYGDVNVGVIQLIRDNGLGNNSKLFPGQKLKFSEAGLNSDNETIDRKARDLKRVILQKGLKFNSQAEPGDDPGGYVENGYVNNGYVI